MLTITKIAMHKRCVQLERSAEALVINFDEKILYLVALTLILPK